jgi:NADPH-dependent 2,4-dienoyl-CoA reductase/sulfur reductase-like enzyme
MTYDLAVLGAGPAGMAAATEAARRGARVVLLEESPQPGGQVHRAAPPGFLMPDDPDKIAGDALRAALARSGAELRLGHRVWGLGGGPLVPLGEGSTPFRIDALAEGAPVTLEARALLLCPGTTERIIPFPGWTLPGVIGLAAATILLKAQGVLPGRRVVVAGAGPLLYAVAAKLLKAGAEVAAVADLATTGEWARALPGLLARPDLLARGAGWRAQLTSRGIPVLQGHRVSAAEGVEVLERVRLAPLEDAPMGEAFDCDALCVGHGLTPATEATRVFRAAHRYDRAAGGWVPVLDADRRTSVPLLYVAGDGGGVRGAAAAPAAGRLAALAALRDLELLDGRAHARARWRPWLEQWRAARTGAAMARMMALRPALVSAIPAETVVCRCEGVTRAEIEAALDDGAEDMNQLKQFTRCGMGPCQGRVCGEAAAELVAVRVGGRERAGFATGRLPLRPVPMEALLGEFDYADIPVPKPAPI